MLFKKRVKANNKGMSLVEVVCAITILGLTATVITSAMSVGMQSYDRGIQETDLQKDAQLLVNQISDLVIDSSSEVSFDASTTTLTIKQGTRVYTIRYDAADHKLYYSDSDNPGVEQVLADGVTAFGIDADEFAKSGNLGVSVGFVSEDGSKDFNCNYTVTCRNGNGASTAVVVRPRIVAPKEIIIEPNQVLPLSRGCSVTGTTATLRYEILSGHGEVTGTTVDSDGNLTCAPNQKDDFWIRVTTNTGDGGAEDSKDICMHVRRVNDIDISGGWDSTSNAERTAGARYELYADFADIQYPAKDNFSIYDDDYVDPYQIQWVVVSGNATVSPHGTNNRMCTLTLGADVSGTNAVKVMAVSKHAGGTNKSGTSYDTVTATYELIPSYIYISDEGGGILRMDHRPQAKLVGGPDGVDGLKARFEEAGYTNVSWRFSFKYKQDADGAVESPWIYSGDVNGWSDADGSMDINLRGAILTMMDRDHGYDIWVRFQIVDMDTNNVLWPSASDPVSDALYITHGYMEKFGCKFDSVVLGNLHGARTNYNAEGVYPVLSFKKGEMKENVLTLSEGNPFLGYDDIGTELENKLGYKIQKKVGDTWVDAPEVYTQSDCPTCKIKFDSDGFDGSYRILTYASQMPRYNVNESGEVVQDGYDAPVLFYTDDIDGVFYFDARQIR